MMIRSLLFSILYLFTCFLLTSTANANAGNLRVTTVSPYVLAGDRQTIPIRIGVSMPQVSDQIVRPEANVAIVLDRSGSMQGVKLEQAKNAAALAVRALRSTDIVSVIVYDDNARVVVPATRLTDRESVVSAINGISVGGSTALFAGVSKGAGEVRKFLSAEKINRVILLSDGLANIGPSSPAELGDLGASLRKEGIVVSTLGLGLGYNEDLMVRLASASDGNHVFVERAANLVSIFRREFDDMLKVAANDVKVSIRLAEGVRPIRALERDAEIIGQDVTISLGQLFQGEERYALLEVELSPGVVGSSLELARVNVEYQNLLTQMPEKRSASTTITFTSEVGKVESASDKETVRDYYTSLANIISSSALKLRDQGKVKDAQTLMSTNISMTREQSSKYKVPALKALADDLDEQAADYEKKGVEWNKSRKGIIMEQRAFELQNTK